MSTIRSPVSWSYEFYRYLPAVEQSESKFLVPHSDTRVLSGGHVLPRREIGNDSCTASTFGLATLARQHSPRMRLIADASQNLANFNSGSSRDICGLRSGHRDIDSFGHLLAVV